VASADGPIQLADLAVGVEEIANARQHVRNTRFALILGIGADAEEGELCIVEARPKGRRYMLQSFRGGRVGGATEEGQNNVASCHGIEVELRIAG
jgi:hypothetical protein